MWATVRNLGVFQGLWFLLVLGGDPFFVFALGWLLFHTFSFCQSGERRLLPIFILVGIVMDSALAALDVYQFNQSNWSIPLWLLGLWLIFPTTLLHGLKWCWSGKIWILIASGFGAALTYIGGARLSDLAFPFGVLPTILILTVCWSLYFGFVRFMALQRS